MGMFDSFRDESGGEWQTKAYGRQLQTWRHGDTVPELADATHHSYQVKVLGGSGPRGADSWRYSLVTVLYNVAAEIPADRDESLPLIDYFGSEVPS